MTIKKTYVRERILKYFIEKAGYYQQCPDVYCKGPLIHYNEAIEEEGVLKEIGLFLEKKAWKRSDEGFWICPCKKGYVCDIYEALARATWLGVKALKKGDKKERTNAKT